MIDINKILKEKYNILPDTKLSIKYLLLTKILKRVLFIDRLNSFIVQNSHLDAKNFINEFFDYLNFTFTISNKDIQKIPAEGKFIIVSNHPIGSLDGLSLLKAVLDVRNDVKILANELLYSIEELRPLLIPLKLDSKSFQKTSIELILKHLGNDSPLIIFPAAEVSRLKWFTIADSKWHKGAIYFARKFNAPILPVFISAKNSILFYIVSIINKRFSIVLLPYELFNKRNKTINIKVGDLIPNKAFSSSLINDVYQTKLLKKHVYSLGRNGKNIYLTEKNIILPLDKKVLKDELNKSDILGITKEDMKLILTNKRDSPNVLSEIARLRELTFRKVGEGTGKRLDLDTFDDHYSHLVLWDDKNLEIVGSYRIGNGSNILNNKGVEGFYTSTLFTFSENFINEYIPKSIELGRSFIQKKYWNSHALNYLWQGIGAYLYNNSSIQYLFGGVSISNSYPQSARELIVFYFSKWFPPNNQYAISKNRMILTSAKIDYYNSIFNSGTAKNDYKILKGMLKPYGFSVPILYKHYSELCDENGIAFLDFGIDPAFENCVDGLILVNTALIKEEKKKKFIKSFDRELNNAAI
ncbi:MAG: lysophospholipid acyltransferase family protein [Melioribacteraceae bacterium]|nr:lysophospholipid acyltransferase family protein [Melioribacteraceae bacterium]